jgi:hypothetical protein
MINLIKSLIIPSNYMLVFFLFISFSSCEDLEDPPTKKTEGEIYFKIVYDLSYPPQNGASSCDVTPGNYKDGNTAVPDYANFNTFYGPCLPGTYSAEFIFNMNASIIYYGRFNYTISRPEPGYKRYYTQILIEYQEDVNRCLIMALNPDYLTYFDEKI